MVIGLCRLAMSFSRMRAGRVFGPRRQRSDRRRRDRRRLGVERLSSASRRGLLFQGKPLSRQHPVALRAANGALPEALLQLGPMPDFDEVSDSVGDEAAATTLGGNTLDQSHGLGRQRDDDPARGDALFHDIDDTHFRCAFETSADGVTGVTRATGRPCPPAAPACRRAGNRNRTRRSPAARGRERASRTRA